jgi:hypothetical protein
VPLRLPFHQTEASGVHGRKTTAQKNEDEEAKKSTPPGKESWLWLKGSQSGFVGEARSFVGVRGVTPRYVLIVAFDDG